MGLTDTTQDMRILAFYVNEAAALMRQPLIYINIFNLKRLYFLK